MSEEADLDPRALIKRRYAQLEGLINPLAELVRVNPMLIEEVIYLALVMGIHAEEDRVNRVRAFELVKEDLHRGGHWSGFKPAP